MAMYEWKETEEEAWIQEFRSNFSFKMWGRMNTFNLSSHMFVGSVVNIIKKAHIELNESYNKIQT